MNRLAALAGVSLMLLLACGNDVDRSPRDGGTLDLDAEPDAGAADTGVVVGRDASVLDAGGTRIVPGDVLRPTACDVVCGDQGLECDPDHSWGLLAGGVEVVYVTCIFTEGCDYVPSAQSLCGAVVEDLSAFRCACM